MTASSHNRGYRRADNCPAAWERRLRKHCDAINALLDEVKQDHPHAMFYLNWGHLDLLWGAAQGDPDGFGGVEGHPERVLCSADLNADGGDW